MWPRLRGWSKTFGRGTQILRSHERKRPSRTRLQRKCRTMMTRFEGGRKTAKRRTHLGVRDPGAGGRSNQTPSPRPGWATNPDSSPFQHAITQNPGRRSSTDALQSLPTRRSCLSDTLLRLGNLRTPCRKLWSLAAPLPTALRTQRGKRSQQSRPWRSFCGHRCATPNAPRRQACLQVEP